MPKLFRVCNVCGGVDDHPRHTFAGVLQDTWVPDIMLQEKVVGEIKQLLESGSIELEDGLRISREFWDTTSEDRHIDCCASVGCPKEGKLDEEGIPAGCGERLKVWNGKTGPGMKAAADKVRSTHVKES